MAIDLFKRIQNLFLFPLLILFSCVCVCVYGSETEEFPVLYKGRYRPAEAYARLWLYDVYHASTLKTEDLHAFQTSSSPLNFLWSLEFIGFTPYQATPLFWIGSADLKNRLDLPLTKNRFSYEELQHALDFQLKNIQLISNKKEKEDLNSLIFSFKIFEQLSGNLSPTEQAFRNRFAELEMQNISPKEIEKILEQEYPLMERLKQAGTLFLSLPSRYKEGEWLPLKALTLQMYSPSSESLIPVTNFTLFSEEQFFTIQHAYFALEKAYQHSNQNKIQRAKQTLSTLLQQAYQPLAGKIFQKAYGKQLSYPSFAQLKMELLYVHYPWIPFLILLYGIGACLLWLSYQQGLSKGYFLSLGIIIFAILCHTLLLAMRCYILERPPVSNMFETVMYVPWVTACVALLIPRFRKQPLVLLAACMTSIGLLLILEFTGLNQSLDHVQAVLDSQFWLLIHVLMVVGSYGLFLLAAIMGHFYLGFFIKYRKETTTMRMLSELILQILYGGTALLIIGTILGGVWAAESWGRFWDWDPKESWAFISSCFYLIWIHAYRFHRIASFGLAIGAVSGWLTISFTWYGVNYILGTGLHSYGFGSGGEYYYYAFLAFESLFLITTLAFHHHFFKKNIVKN